MEIKYDVTITAIGSLAHTFLENNDSIIILDKDVRPNLADMVVEHVPGELKEEITVDDKLKIGNSEFKVISVGDAANDTIREEGHCTIVVNAEGSMPGQIIVKGPVAPRLHVGDQIQFYKK